MGKYGTETFSDAEGERNQMFVIDIPNNVKEVPGPTGPAFDLSAGGVSICISLMHAHIHTNICI